MAAAFFSPMKGQIPDTFSFTSEEHCVSKPLENDELEAKNMSVCIH